MKLFPTGNEKVNIGFALLYSTKQFHSNNAATYLTLYAIHREMESKRFLTLNLKVAPFTDKQKKFKTK